MAISVAVPKDLSGIKTKVALNLTTRQLVCFGPAVVIGFGLFFLTKDKLGSQGAVLLMMVVIMPFFFLAMYERDGMPAEKVIYLMLRQKVFLPGIRPYKSENLFKQLEEREAKEKEVAYLEEKTRKRASKE